MSAVSKIEPAQPATASAPINEASALVAMIERAARDPNVDIDKMERMFQMHERVTARAAESAFNVAMSAAQAELIPVVRNLTNSHTRSKYADLDAIAGVLPTVHKHGFGLSFSEFQSPKPGYLGVACKVTNSGHAERYEFHIPIDAAGSKGAVNKTDVQAYGSTFTYGRRYAIFGVFNIITTDNDGNKSTSSAVITKAQVAVLQTLIDETKTNIDQFLAFGKVASLADITAESFGRAVGMLQAKKARMMKDGAL